MEISKELQDFLNDDHVLDLISAGDYKTLFSMQTLSRRTMNYSQLHSVLLNSGIASTQEILDILGYVPDGFFSMFDNLTSIKLPHNITSIGAYAFSDCSSFTSGCIGLTSFIVPNGVTSIGSHAFTECYNLKTIYFNGTKDQWKQVKKAGNWKSGTNSVKIICRG